MRHGTHESWSLFSKGHYQFTKGGCWSKNTVVGKHESLTEDHAVSQGSKSPENAGRKRKLPGRAGQSPGNSETSCGQDQAGSISRLLHLKQDGVAQWKERMSPSPATS